MWDGERESAREWEKERAKKYATANAHAHAQADVDAADIGTRIRIKDIWTQNADRVNRHP